MKIKTGVLLGVILSYYGYAQNNNKYLFPHKTENFSQLDWLEVMSEMANDTFILNCMKGIEKGPMVITHLPYVCLLNSEHKIVLQFCPDCNWKVLTCTDYDCIAKVSVVSDAYGFRLDNVYAQNIWNQGDTVVALLFLLHVDPYSGIDNAECALIPVISNVYIPAYPVFPSKRKGLK